PHRCRSFSRARPIHRNSLGGTGRIFRQSPFRGWRDILKGVRLWRAVGFCRASGRNKKVRLAFQKDCEGKTWPWKNLEPSPARFKRMKTIPHLTPLPLGKREAIFLHQELIGIASSRIANCFRMLLLIRLSPFWGED